jgi:hypothetical protein
MSALAGLALEATKTDTADATRGMPALETRTVSGSEWDSIVSGFDGVCQEQLFAFASTRWPKVKLEPRLFECKGQIVGGALVMVQDLRLARMAICKWGPMLEDTESADPVRRYVAMVQALVDEFAHRRGMLLSILPHASPEPINGEYRALRDLGFERGYSLQYPSRYMVNLRLGEEEQRKSFQQTWRRQLAKAEKSGLSFEHGQPERLGEFKTLYGAMTDRKQFPDYSAFDTIDALMHLDEPLRPEQFYVRHEGEVVAGALIFKAGSRAVYLYGATNDRALPLRAGYFLHWHIIRWLRDHTRAHWYDLGGTDGFQGLHQFKKGMVGDAGLIRSVPPVVNFASNSRARFIGNAALSAREHANRFKRRFLPKGAKPDTAPAELEDQFK